MWVFITLLCLIGALLTLIRVSLCERKKGPPAMLAGLIVLNLCSLPWATRINMQGLTRFLNRLDVLNNLCTVLVIESILMLLLLAYLMKQHAERKSASVLGVASLAPSPACLAGIFVLMVYLFNSISGHSYWLIGGLYNLGLLVALGGGSVLLRRVLSAWSARLEVMLILSFVQLVLAMFLPLVARGLTVPAHQGSHSLWALPVGMALSLPLVALALVVRKAHAAFFGDRIS